MGNSQSLEGGVNRGTERRLQVWGHQAEHVHASCLLCLGEARGQGLGGKGSQGMAVTGSGRQRWPVLMPPLSLDIDRAQG